MNHQFESNLYLPMRCDVCSKHKFDPCHVEPKLPETFEDFWSETVKWGHSSDYSDTYQNKKALATVLDRESASTARYDAKIDKLEADNLALRQLLKEYREEHVNMCDCYVGINNYGCTLCRKYDALESK